MPDDNTNLPILDDIIKPGDTDKAVHRPSSKVHSSLLSDDETEDASTASMYAETGLHTENDDQPDSVELDTDNPIDIDAIDHIQVSPATATDDELPTDEPIQQGAHAETDQSRPSAIELPDIDAISEEILGNLMPEIEQLLRDKIQQTLRQHFPGGTRPD